MDLSVPLAVVHPHELPLGSRCAAVVLPSICYVLAWVSAHFQTYSNLLGGRDLSFTVLNGGSITTVTLGEKSWGVRALSISSVQETTLEQAGGKASLCIASRTHGERCSVSTVYSPHLFVLT